MAEIDSYLSSGTLDEALQAAKSKLADMGQLQEKLSSLVGVAESEDGRIRAESDNARGLKKLTLDPRALRMGSEELAETITQVVADAIADLRRQSQEAVQEEMGQKDFDPEAGRARIQAARESFDRIALDAQAELERLHRRLSGATAHLRRPETDEPG